MRVSWKRACGAIKDRNSIWIAKLSRKGPFRNPDLETVMIKATSHDDHRIDSKNAQRVFRWLRTSPLCLKPLVWSLSMRIQKTRSWAVALKGLILMHGVFCCNLPMVNRIGRLPFDLSNFCDRHLSPSNAWGFNSFVRAYFAYLDQRSAFVSSQVKKPQKINEKEVEVVQVDEVEVVQVDAVEVVQVDEDEVEVEVEVEVSLMEELEKLQKFQGMIDMLLQIKPRCVNMYVGLILEAMDCVIIEVFDVYSKFCNNISKVLLRIYEVGGKVEAGIALKVLQKASVQREELCFFFEFCRDIGVLNASQCPKIERIPEEDIRDLERIISGASAKKCLEGVGVYGANREDKKTIVMRHYCPATAIVSKHKESENGLTTVITQQWEVFEDDIMSDVKGCNVSSDSRAIVSTTNPFEDSHSYSLHPCFPVHCQALPDLISL
ncbi:hypothetical protein VNO77_01488 [Canavalia gladiata]|uniref:ENTH domain-containing protein n=1 Tax=Canavalia gladiata TaxID=3824 RepID=A0AAN9MWI4_CANGL